MALLFDKLMNYLQYPFVVYALIVGTLIALCAALLGVSLVLKRFSYIGTGLSNLAFGVTIIAGILDIRYDLPVVLLVTILCAVFLLGQGQRTRIQGDASIAMLSVSALAIGYLMMNLFPTSSNVSADVCATLFGSTSILTLSMSDVYLSVVLSILVVALFILCYNKLFAITFDEDFSVAIGTNARGYNLLVAIVTAVIIVLAMQLVGSLLITALIIFPAISAMRVFKSFKSVVLCSAVLGVICAIIGLIASILAGTPVGSSIVAVHLVIFILFTFIGKFTR